MWTIRQEQSEAFRQYHLQKFEDEMVEHLKVFAARLCEIRGDQCIRQVIRLGIARASQYGLTNRGPVRFFIELMFTLGSEFDTDFQYPWVANILQDTKSDQAVRADRIFFSVGEYMDYVAGPRRQFTLDALRKLKDVDFREVRTASEDLERQIVSQLEAIHPQKCAYVGDPVLRKLVKTGAEATAVYGIRSGLGIAVLVGLMFGFGTGVLRDPLYPWVSSTLGESSLKDPEAQAERLLRKSKLYAEHLVANLQAEQDHV